MGNRGWKVIADKVPDTHDVLQFESYFCDWQREAILLTEITYAEDYTYVAPLGVFTHIGTLARALQYIFEKDWTIDASLTGDELSFLVDKHIKGGAHSFKCKFVELDQAYSDKHCDGWKLGSSIRPSRFRIGVPYVQALAAALLNMLHDPELEATVNYVDGRGVEVKRLDNLYLTLEARVAEDKAESSESE